MFRIVQRAERGNVAVWSSNWVVTCGSFTPWRLPTMVATMESLAIRVLICSGRCYQFCVFLMFKTGTIQWLPVLCAVLACNWSAVTLPFASCFRSICVPEMLTNPSMTARNHQKKAKSPHRNPWIAKKNCWIHTMSCEATWAWRRLWPSTRSAGPSEK